MAILGGLDLHRGQLTFDYLDQDTGEVTIGRIVPADRRQLRAWLERFAGEQQVPSPWKAAPAGAMWSRNWSGPGSPRTWPSPPRPPGCAAPRPTGPTPGICVSCCWRTACRRRGFAHPRAGGAGHHPAVQGPAG
jgi:hypothetical protein